MIRGTKMINGRLLRLARRVYHIFRIGKFCGFWESTKVDFCVPGLKRSYAEKLRSLRGQRSRKVRVVFLVSESSKWKVQSVYERLSQDARFDIIVVVSLYGWHDDLSSAEAMARQTYSYFSERGMHVRYAYSFEKHAPVSLEEFSPDIVFYDQPWDVFPCHSPNVVGRFALTFYVDYGVPNLAISVVHCALPFHRMLFCHYTVSRQWTDLANQICRRFKMAGEMVPTGHPMLDEFSDCDFDKTPRNGCVVFAPHWSFPHHDNPNTMDLSTFLWTGLPILDYARRHPERKWAFKPHPVLRGMLIKSGAMSKEDVEAYYKAWEAIGECCYSGDYPSLFKRSSAMITDSSSFLLEYACTGRPLIRLVNRNQKAKFCQLSQPLFNTYYQIRSPEELEPVLDKIVLRGEDPNREARLAAAKAMNLTGVDAAGNIVAHLEKLIWGQIPANG